MKNIYSLASLFFVLIISAQNIEFTDPNFKNALLNISISSERAKDLNGNWCIVDTNSNDEIEVSEALSLSYLDVNFRSIASLSEISYFTNLVYLNCSRNELSTINLSSLTSLEILNCGYNDLNEIDWSQNINLIELQIGYNNLSSLDLSNLVNLQKFYCSEMPIEGIDVSSNIQLTHLGIWNTNTTAIDVTQNLNLEYLGLGLLDISSVDISTNENLETLLIYDCNLNSIDLSNNPNLTDIILGNNNLSSVDLSNNTNLLYFNCDSNNITELDFSNNLSLKGISCMDNLLTEIDVSFLNNLDNLLLSDNNLGNFDISNNYNMLLLKCDNTNINQLDVSNNPYLHYISCANNNLTDLDLSSNLGLKTFFCSGNNFTSLDLSHLTSLANFNCSNNNLQYLNITNTNITVFDQNNFVSNNYQEVCCKENLYVSMYEFLNLHGYIDGNGCILKIGSFCTPTYNSLISIKYNPESINCLENNQILSDYSVSVVSEGIDSQFEFNENSIHRVYYTNLPATISPLFNSNYFTVTPENYQLDSDDENFQTLEFCVAPIGEHNDLEISIIPLGDAIPGFLSEYMVLYKNRGTTILSGNVQITFEENYMNFESAQPETFSLLENMLSFEFTDLVPFETRNFNFTMTLNTPTDIDFPLNADDELYFQATINTPNEETPENNIASLNEVVVNSYDPNDKILLEGQSISPEMVGEYVHYRIRFENNGTANAYNIIIEDYIDPEKFDISTLEVINASHQLRTEISDNVVKFQFYNINLPFDDSYNDGYVVFKIKTLSTLEVNDTFSNQAQIYFDYNFPIDTNTAIATIEELGVEDLIDYTSVVIYPNPTSEYFKIKTEEQIEKIELFDSNGKLIKVFIGEQYNNVENLNEGVYFLKIYTQNEIKKTKLVKE